MDFRNGAFTIGRLFGITIRIHILFVLWIGFDLLKAGRDWAFDLLVFVMVFGVVLCHEFGHCLGARLVGGKATDILLWPLGGLAYAQAPMRPWPQFVTVVFGPLVNLLFCIVSAGVLITWLIIEAIAAPAEPSLTDFSFALTSWHDYVLLFFVLNLLLLGFNLLPIFPFDGGQILRTVLWRWLGLERATLIAAKTGIVGAGVLGIAGAMGREFDLIFLALFTGATSLAHYRAARAGLVAEKLTRTESAQRQDRVRGGLFRRVFRPDHSMRADPIATPPPPEPPIGPAKPTGRAADDRELARILKRVHESGVQSLSYVERQTLERITRERRAGEDQYKSDDRL